MHPLACKYMKVLMFLDMHMECTQTFLGRASAFLRSSLRYFRPAHANVSQQPLSVTRYQCNSHNSHSPHNKTKQKTKQQCLMKMCVCYSTLRANKQTYITNKQMQHQNLQQMRQKSNQQKKKLHTNKQQQKNNQT